MQQISSLTDELVFNECRAYCFEQFYEILFRCEFAQAGNIYLLLVRISIGALFPAFWIRNQDAHGPVRLELSTMKFQSVLGRGLQRMSLVGSYWLAHVLEMCTGHNKTVSYF